MKRKNMSIRIRPEIWEAYKKHCEKNCLSKSRRLETIINNYLDIHDDAIKDCEECVYRKRMIVIKGRQTTRCPEHRKELEEKDSSVRMSNVSKSEGRLVEFKRKK